MDLVRYFVDKGIYKQKSLPNTIFLCEALEGSSIGKLVSYKKISLNIYERTNISYFLNSYQEGDMKEVFVNRSYYDMIGKINDNYEFVDNYIIKRNKNE